MESCILDSTGATVSVASYVGAAVLTSKTAVNNPNDYPRQQNPPIGHEFPEQVVEADRIRTGIDIDARNWPNTVKVQDCVL